MGWVERTTPNDANLRIELHRLMHAAATRGDDVLASILVSAVHTLDLRLAATDGGQSVAELGGAAALEARRVRVRGRTVAVRLERAFWDMLDRTATETMATTSELCEVALDKWRGSSLTSALRVDILHRQLTT